MRVVSALFDIFVCYSTRKKFRVFTALPPKTQVVWDVMSCYMVTIYRRFEGACRLRLQRKTVQEKSLTAQSFQEIPSCAVWPCDSSERR
jgi:hypothetical protein